MSVFNDIGARGKVGRSKSHENVGEGLPEADGAGSWDFISRRQGTPASGKNNRLKCKD
jgi:hypothetical protein